MNEGQELSHTHQPPRRWRSVALRLRGVRAEAEYRVRGFSLLSAEASERSDTPCAALVPEGHTGIVPPKCCLSWDSASLTG